MISFGTDDFPAFFSPSSGVTSPLRLDTAADVAAAAKVTLDGTGSRCLDAESSYHVPVTPSRMFPAHCLPTIAGHHHGMIDLFTS